MMNTPLHTANAIAGRGADIIDSIGGPAFFSNTADHIEWFLPHDFCLVLLHRKKRSPLVLHDGLTPNGYGRGLKNFMEETNVINPLRFDTGQQLSPGIHLMRDLSAALARRTLDDIGRAARRDSHEELGYRTIGWPEAQEEVLLVVPVADNALVEISLSRQRTRRHSVDSYVSRLRRVAPLISSAVRKHCAILDIFNEDNSISSVERVADELRAFSGNKLSHREIEVLGVILTGASSLAIADALSIALPTVKSHRRNAYRKLNIGSQVELFSLAMQLVQNQQAARFFRDCPNDDQSSTTAAGQVHALVN